MKKLLTSALLLFLSSQTFAFSQAAFELNDLYKPVDMFDDNAEMELVISGPNAYNTIQRMDTKFGLRDHEKLSIKVIEIIGATDTNVEDIFVGVNISATRLLSTNSRRSMFGAFVPDVLSENRFVEFSNQLSTGEELELNGDEINKTELKAYRDGEKMIRVELGEEKTGLDELHGTFAINPAQLEQLKIGEKVRFVISDTLSGKNTVATAIIEISKENL